MANRGDTVHLVWDTSNGYDDDTLYGVYANYADAIEIIEKTNISRVVYYVESVTLG